MIRDIAAAVRRRRAQDTARLVLQVFCAFIDSQLYAQWVEATLAVDCSTGELDYHLDGLLADRRCISVAAVMIRVAESSLRMLPDCASLVDDYWFRVFVEMAETLPLALTLSIPHRDRGFPLVFANALFEIDTSYTRARVFGTPNPLLSREEAMSEEALAEMQTALTESVPHRYCTRTTTMLSLPMYDTHGRHCFTLSAVSKEGGQKAVNTMWSFLAMVPLLIM